jgi:RNA polymerase sigma-70 factor (ECF subfamily)
MLEDEHLVWRLKGGDKEALRWIYEKYKDSLLTIAVSLLHDIGDAEDVLHDVFVSFARAARQLQLRSSLHSYLATSVANRVRDKFRRSRSRALEVSQVKPGNSNSVDPEQSAILSEESQLLTAALTKVPLEQREVIILRLKGGMRFKEIADLQGVSLGTVQARYKYGLDKLRTILNGELGK